MKKTLVLILVCLFAFVSCGQNEINDPQDNVSGDAKALVYIDSDVMIPDTAAIDVYFRDTSSGSTYRFHLTTTRCCLDLDIPQGDYSVDVSTSGFEANNCGEYTFSYNHAFSQNNSQTASFSIRVDNRYLRENGRRITYVFDKNAELHYFRCFSMGFSYGDQEQLEYSDYPSMSATFVGVSDGESRTVYLTSEYLRGNNSGSIEFVKAGGRIITKPFEWEDLQCMESELHVTSTYGEGRTAFIEIHFPGLTEHQRSQLFRVSIFCGEDSIGGWSGSYIPQEDYSYLMAVKTGPQQISVVLTPQGNAVLDFNLTPDIGEINLASGDTLPIHFAVVPAI